MKAHVSLAYWPAAALLCDPIENRCSAAFAERVQLCRRAGPTWTKRWPIRRLFPIRNAVSSCANIKVLHAPTGRPQQLALRRPLVRANHTHQPAATPAYTAYRNALLADLPRMLERRTPAPFYIQLPSQRRKTTTPRAAIINWCQLGPRLPRDDFKSSGSPCLDLSHLHI